MVFSYFISRDAHANDPKIAGGHPRTGLAAGMCPALCMHVGFAVPSARQWIGIRPRPVSFAPVASISRAVDAMAVIRDLLAKPGRRASLLAQLSLSWENTPQYCQTLV
ncbi:hypothetical protein [Pseudopelagicola sp. nBUS_19]|uniref:hypothetical protein n=1 Tax=Pseudopelagicola sp. nBUS_19 TaxID=3395316 RepID=UPI003EC0E7C4